jgi:spermidine synthase
MAANLTVEDKLVFYEIDPAVIGIATDGDLFTFLADSDPRIDIVEGDGRLSLSRVPPGRHDMIVIDAFSSDAIPVHLLTREAVATYRAALADGEVIAFHVSNNYFHLVPVVSRLAGDAGMEVLFRSEASARSMGAGRVPAS